MNKKVLIIRGSARKDGFTNMLCDEATAFLANCEIKNFNTFEVDFLPCDGCNYCESAGRCRHRDLDVFFEDFCEADTVIFASPVYNGGFSAPMKSLIDRFQVFYTRFYAEGKVQPVKKRKQAFLITASGRKGEESALYMKKSLECAFTILNTEMKSTVHCANTDTEPTYTEALKLMKGCLTDD